MFGWKASLHRHLGGQQIKRPFKFPPHHSLKNVEVILCHADGLQQVHVLVGQPLGRLLSRFADAQWRIRLPKALLQAMEGTWLLESNLLALSWTDYARD